MVVCVCLFEKHRCIVIMFIPMISVEKDTMPYLAHCTLDDDTCYYCCYHHSQIIRWSHHHYHDQLSWLYTYTYIYICVCYIIFVCIGHPFFAWCMNIPAVISHWYVGLEECRSGKWSWYLTCDDHLITKEVSTWYNRGGPSYALVYKP